MINIFSDLLNFLNCRRERAWNIKGEDKNKSIRIKVNLFGDTVMGGCIMEMQLEKPSVKT